MSTGSHTNRLARESSPYLLQHQHNPVDWYPWGPEAFAAARAQNKPIFLSVGYSTCYWCHVMERQCFENEAIAAEMNARFINIKVDREERPDVDQLYMTATQVLTRHGGWPMSVFLTPGLRPFYAGTYFPPTDMGNRPGFPRLLRALSEAWTARAGELEETADGLLSVLHQLASPRPPKEDGRFDSEMLESLIERSIEDYEPHYGGFGQAPKFPRQTLLQFLLDYLEGDGNDDLQTKVAAMLEYTLDTMDRGGIHDHLGGGFHRYSTDAKWLVPHFEIMLYDQAMLAEAYATGARVLEDPRWGNVARGICEFVLREMTSPAGAFYTAFDAEVDHQEGKNYLWTEAEIQEVLGATDAAVFNCVFGVDQGPNFADPHHGTGEATANILFLDRPVEAAAHEHGIPADELAVKLAAWKAKLKAVRDARKQPLLDTKILTSWCALMAGALARVGRELQEPRYTAAAVKACRFLLANHRGPDGSLLRTSRENSPAKFEAFLDDYAALADACLATGDASLKGEAEGLTRLMLEKFGKDLCASCGPAGTCGGSGGCASGGGLFFTSESADDLIVRQKIGTDSPLPTGNAQAAEVLIALGQDGLARGIFADFAGQLSENGESMSSMLRALQRSVRAHGPLEVKGRGGMQRPATPEELARSVVDLETRQLTRTHLQIRLLIAEGYHLYAPGVQKPFIATDLALDNAEVMAPAAATLESPEPVPVYQGQAVFDVHLGPGATFPLKGRLTYQACDESACLPPVTRAIELAL